MGDPVLRLRTALRETYGWARTAAPMMTKIHRDVDSMPAFVGQFLADDEKTRVAALTTGFRVRGRASRRSTGCLAHALRMSTWESLAVAYDVIVGTATPGTPTGQERSVS